MRLVLLLLVFAGVVMIMANELVNARNSPAVVYRYLPRDLDTYLREEPFPSAVFADMWTQEGTATQLRNK